MVLNCDAYCIFENQLPVYIRSLLANAPSKKGLASVLLLMHIKLSIQLFCVYIILRVKEPHDPPTSDSENLRLLKAP